MDKIGQIQIKVSGKKGSFDLAPQHYDIGEIKEVLEQVENLLFPSSKKDRPIISYDIESGSVRHIFKTSLQAVIGFSAILSQVNASESIDFLELKTALAIESFQNLSYQKNYEFEIGSSLEKTPILIINTGTNYQRTETTWAESEFYFYGILTNAGGKGKVNIHIDTDEFGVLKIDTPKEMLERMEENLLYKNYGIRAEGKQNLETGEIDRSSLKIVELIDYDAKFSESYLNSLIKKAKPKLKDTNIEEWLNNMRGSYEA